MIAKIRKLFVYRDFDCHNKLGEFSKVKKDRLEYNLLRVKQDIYFLDEYLKSNWELDEAEKKLYSSHIHRSFSNLGVASSDYDLYSAHIYKYQEHETYLRAKKDSLMLSMEYFYI